MSVLTLMPAPLPVTEALSLAQARDLLARYVVPMTREDACDALTRCQESLTLLTLYQANFPAQFVRSSAPLLAAPGDPFGPRELEFFDLVERQLFYFNQDYYVESCYESWGLGFLVPNIGITICLCSDTFDEHPLGWQLLILLMGATGATAADLNLPATDGVALADLLAGPAPNGQLDWERFTRLSAAHPALGQALVHAVEVIDHSTGNLFLDQDCCQDATEAFWCQELDRPSYPGVS